MNKFFSLASLVITIICTFSGVDCVQGIKFVSALPFTYFLCITISRSNKQMMHGPGMIMLNIILFARYCITPLAICLNNSVSVYARNYDYIPEAILVMIVEIVSMFFTMACIKEQSRPQKSEVFSTLVFKEFRNNYIIVALAVLIVIGIILTNQSILGSFYIITSGEVYNDVASETSGLVGMMWKGFVTFLLIYLVAYIKNRNWKDIPKIVSSIIVCVIYLILMYIGQASIARWFLLASAVVIICLLMDMYPRHKKLVVLIVGIPMVILLISASITKNTSLTGSTDIAAVFGALISPTNMDTYFAGPVGVNNAIGMKANSDVSLFNLVYDLLNNFPGIADHVDKSMVTNKIYNTYVFNSATRSDQILPLVGQSFSLFSYALTPLLSIISVRLVVYFDKKYYEVHDLRCYCFAFCGVWVGIATVLNLTICISWFYSIIIPLYLILWVYEKVEWRLR